MTLPEFSADDLPGVWFTASDLPNWAEVEAELHREVAPGHVLHGVRFEIVAVRRHLKDVVGWLPESRQWGWTHLTWHEDVDPRRPATDLYDSWAALVADHTTHPEERVAAAQARLDHMGDADNDTWARAFDELGQAERELAAGRGEQYAEVIDVGARWDVGAPLPHLITAGGSAYVVCWASDPGSWDGPPREPDPAPVLVIEIAGCHDVRFGGPNDEALAGHPLDGKGLEAYEAHEVRNSEWVEHARRVNSVHPYHSDEGFRGLRHFVLAFHDEMVEALGDSVTATRVPGTITSVLTDLVTRITGGRA